MSMSSMKEKFCKSYIAIFFILFLGLVAMMFYCASKAEAAPIDPGLQPETIVNCVLPTEREDNTPFDFSTDGEAIVWYFGFSPGNYTQSVTTPACQWIIDNKVYPAGSLYFVAATKDKDGRESVFSDMITHEIGGVVANPKPPTGFSIDSPRKPTATDTQ